MKYRKKPVIVEAEQFDGSHSMPHLETYLIESGRVRR